MLRPLPLRRRMTIAVALAVAAVNFLVFTYWLRVPLPVGVLGF